METIERVIKKARNWYDGYVAGSLAPDQRKFWIVFWGSVIASCAVYYLCTFYTSDYWGKSQPKYTGLFIRYLCVLLPALVLRRLHIYALFFAGYLLANWLGVLRLAFWLLVLFGVAFVRHNRISSGKQ